MATQTSQPNGSLPTYHPNGSLPTSQPNVSQATSSQSNASHDTESGLVEKLLVMVTTCGKAVGPNQAKFHSQAGHYIKYKIPLFFPEWKEVDQHFKDAVWNKLTTEFKFNIPVTLARIHLEKGFPAKWRVIKSRIRTKYLKDAGSIEEAIKRCPDGFDRGNWELFVIRENDPKVIAINKQNAENRKRNLSDFCGGRQSYAQKLYLMDKASPEKQHGRVDVWLKSRERPDGTVPESIREKYVSMPSYLFILYEL
ncbi:hypothetical protein FRX31_011244 [Thalictrum thalictroides]|uniref:Uncharacterized protein n=1 Tax=Thalictrum thalictroides TaxID=46969 RepID=A0A7J6WP66_THATH|nr:hypothetical protein FRX31_011244 [Thalictrum thalictroides]